MINKIDMLGILQSKGLDKKEIRKAAAVGRLAGYALGLGVRAVKHAPKIAGLGTKIARKAKKLKLFKPKQMLRIGGRYWKSPLRRRVSARKLASLGLTTSEVGIIGSELGRRAKGVKRRRSKKGRTTLSVRF